MTDRGSAAPLSGRLHGLDALRAGALLLGIVFHGLLPYVAGFRWIIADRSTSPIASVVVAWAHLFRMPLFLLLAGFFARMSLARKGTWGFARDRLKRIGLPLLVFWPIAVVPVVAIAIVYGWLHSIPNPQPAPDDPLLLISPGHLWFLWQLLGLYAVLLLVRALVTRLDRSRRRDRVGSWLGDLLATPAGVLLASLPHLAAIALQGWRSFAIEGPATIRPELAAYLAFGGAFLIGWLLYGRPDLLTGLYGAVGVYLWVYASLALAIRFLSGENSVLRYLADSSYWLYLLHLGLIGALGLLVADLPWPWWIKITITFTGTVALLLGSYELLVRHTWVGRWLNGRSFPRRRHGVESG